MRRIFLSNVVVERVTDERLIRRHMPLDEIPGLVIDGRLVSTGRVPGQDELLVWFSPVGEKVKDQ